MRGQTPGQPLTRKQIALLAAPLLFAVIAIFLGLAWGWVARQTGSIRWTVAAHILLDFAGIAGWMFL